MIVEKDFYQIHEENKGVLVFHMPEWIVNSQKEKISKNKSENYLKKKQEVIPYSALSLKNPQELYRITKTFELDIEKGKKAFGFVGVNKINVDLTMLAIASCLSYTKGNSSVAIIVEDLKNSIWNKYSDKFVDGFVGEWKTKEWGELCFIDYSQIKQSTRLHHITDFKLIYSEFDAVLWAMPKDEDANILKESYLDILRSIDSISVILKAGGTSMKELKLVENRFGVLGIPLKGIMYERGEL